MNKINSNGTSRNQYLISLIKKDLNPGTLKLSFIKETLKKVLSKYDINEIYLFGSYARGDEKESSDVDIFCERGNVKGFFEQAKMMNELEEALGKKVNVIFTTAKLDDCFEKELKKDLIKLC